jgi:hypothetical protein
MNETDKRIKELEGKVDFLLKITGFTVGFMECTVTKFAQYIKEMMLSEGYKDFGKEGNENE